VVSVNRVGFEPDPSGVSAGAQFWGHSFAAGCQGELLAMADNDHEQVLVVDLDRERSEQVRRFWPFFRDRRIDAYGDLSRRYRD
jgi:N-carbamoylputrescine amidase